MAITSSAKKAWRASLRKKVFNDARKTNVKKTLKVFQKHVREKNAAEAGKALAQVFKALDKAAKAGTLPKRNASRNKSRLSKLVKSIA